MVSLAAHLLLLLLPALGSTSPLRVVADGDSLPAAMLYLMKYGYMATPQPGQNRAAALLSRDGLREYILKFQAFAGLAQTGELDAKTVELMNSPRCGVTDTTGRAGARKRRYALQGSRWKVRKLTYKISKYPTSQKLTRQEVDKEMKKALAVWSDVTDLTFEEKTGGVAHIDIRFENSRHGDGDPFDGVGGTLAHAFFPVFGGDVHFDSSETWTINSYSGTNLLQTAAHEFGHSLGLSHSDQYRALMAPFYRGYESKVTLDRDDITAIQALYGTKTEKPPTPSGSPPVLFPSSTRGPETTPGIPSIFFPSSPGSPETSTMAAGAGTGDLCTNSSIDSMLTTLDGSTYVFQGDQFWKLTSDSVAAGYPKLISAAWPGLPSNIGASFMWKNGKTYFFRGSQYWRYSDATMDKGYPKEISQGFEGIPNNLDAAFVWSGNEKIYFFKGSKYWKFDPEQVPPVRSTYPRPISSWEGVPDNIDDAIQYSNGYTYFFKEGLYYRFDDTRFQVSEGSPPYPRPTSYWWFGCTDSL